MTSDLPSAPWHRWATDTKSHSPAWEEEDRDPWTAVSPTDLLSGTRHMWAVHIHLPEETTQGPPAGGSLERKPPQSLSVWRTQGEEEKRSSWSIMKRDGAGDMRLERKW